MYDQRWSEEWIEQEFTADWRAYIFEGVLAHLARWLPAGGRSLLDLGAHVGRFVHAAAEDGWTAEGVELNPRTAAFAARRTGAVIHRMNAQALADTGRRYDAVTLLDVLEHIPDPVALLSTAASLVRPAGWIAVKVPCGAAQLRKERVRAWLRPGRPVSVADNLVHVNHFSPGSLRLALERAGFADVRVTIGAPELPQPAARLRWMSRANAGRLVIYWLARSIPGGVHTPLALNLQAYARRPGGESAP
jgi:SAM-dependent methyltransferase